MLKDAAKDIRKLAVKLNGKEQSDAAVKNKIRTAGNDGDMYE